ncbi:Dynein light chain, partial [Globisporangium splendens]
MDDNSTTPAPVEDGETEVKIPKITILRLELATSLQDEVVVHLIEFLQANPNAIEKDISTDMKKYFDQRHDQTWHCIVGRPALHLAL